MVYECAFAFMFTSMDGNVYVQQPLPPKCIHKSIWQSNLHIWMWHCGTPHLERPVLFLCVVPDDVWCGVHGLRPDGLHHLQHGSRDVQQLRPNTGDSILSHA